MRPAALLTLIAALAPVSGCLDDTHGVASGAASDATNDIGADATQPSPDAGSDAMALDGEADASPPDVIAGACEDAWALVLVGDVWPSAVTTLPDGAAVVVGRFGGALTIGAHSLASEEKTAFAARIDAGTCEVAWLVALGVGLAPSDVAAGGTPGGPLVVAATRSADGFATSGHVLYLDPGTGALEDDVPMVAEDIGFGAAAWPRAVAVAEGGFVYVGGELRGRLTVAGVTRQTSEFEPTAGFVVRLCPGHAPIWFSAVRGRGDLSLTDIAVTPGGDVVATGRFYEDLFVSASSPATTSQHGHGDLYVVELAADTGVATWGTALGVVAADGASLAVDDDGAVFVAALFYEHADASLPRGVHVGSAPDRHLVARIGEDGWLTSFDAGLVRHMGGPNPFVAVAVGQLYVAGAILETTTLAPEQVVEGDFSYFQGWLARFDVNSPILWGVTPVAGAGDQRITGLAADSLGRSWLIGRHGGEVVVDDERHAVDGAGAFILRRPPGPGW